MKKRALIVLILLIAAAGAAGAAYLDAWRGDIRVLADSNPAAACREVRLVFRTLAAAGFAGMLAAGFYLMHPARRLIRTGADAGGGRPGKAKGLTAAAAGAVISLTAIAFAWLALRIDGILACEKLPTSHVGDFVVSAQ